MREYANEVAARVGEKLGKEVEVIEVEKMNEKLTGVCIKDGCVGANYYIDDDFKDGVSVEESAEKIASHFNGVEIPKGVEDFDFGYDAIKDFATVRLIDIDKNMDFLKNVVCRNVGCGLALIVDINSKDWRVVVTNDLADRNGYDKDELIDTALKNSEKVLPAEFTTMMGALFTGKKNMLEMDDPSGEAEDAMYILTNEEGLFGASAICYEGVLDKVKEILGSPYFVLPSSVHEVIIVPDKHDQRAEDLKKIVMDANRNVVEAKDVLSDSVYYFDGELREVA